MEKEPIIIGKNLTPEDKETIRGGFKKVWEITRQPVEGEPEKTPEELKYIEKINNYLGEEFKEIGLGEPPEILTGQIHLLPEEVFKKTVPKAEADAIIYSNRQASYLNKSAATAGNVRLPLYKVMAHEALHLASHYKYRLDKEKGGFPYRMGYAFYGLKKEREFFIGLNEAMTEKMVQDIFRKHEGDILKEFGIPEEEKSRVFWYDEYIKPLDAVISKIAAKNNETEEVVWKRFKRGFFTGEMMHLREVEKTFGKDALQVFAVLGTETKSLSREEINEAVLDYFQTEDSETREKIAEEILRPKGRRIKIEFE